MDYLEKTSKDFVRGTGAYGDWLRLAGPQHSDAIGTAYYYYMATAHGPDGRRSSARPTMRTRYAELADNIKAAFVSNYIKEDGRIVDPKDETGQTFYALAFGLDLVPAERRAQVAAAFRRRASRSRTGTSPPVSSAHRSSCSPSKRPATPTWPTSWCLNQTYPSLAAAGHPRAPPPCGNAGTAGCRTRASRTRA